MAASSRFWASWYGHSRPTERRQQTGIETGFTLADGGDPLRLTRGNTAHLGLAVPAFSRSIPTGAFVAFAVIPMTGHCGAMRTMITIVIGTVLLSGCAGKSVQANVAEGCYRFDDGIPFFRVAGKTGTFVDESSLKSFEIGPWRSDGREVEVTPAFILHDGTVSAPTGAARMAEAVETRSSGVVRYNRVNDQVMLSIPVEAFGWATVHLGKPC